MKYKIITISREFGSGGHSIGKAVAERLNIPFYDQILLEHIAIEQVFRRSLSRKPPNMLRRGTVCSLIW